MAAVAAAAAGEGEGDAPKTTAGTSGSTEGEPSTAAKVDLAFVLDATGSMSSYIVSARKSINDISAKIKAEDISVQFALVAYRDHPPQDSTFVTQVTEFTPLPVLIKRKLDVLSASGGGDAPEAVAAALFDARHLKWRPDAAKIIVLIADAPPHGLETSGDGFPDEDPLTKGRRTKAGLKASDKFHDILKTVREIRDELEATIYTVACEPSVSCSYDWTRDFYQFVAECTDGKFLPLSSADLLPKVIVGSVKQRIAMDALENRLDEELAKIKEEFSEEKGREPTDEELDDLLTAKFQAAGMQVDDISVDKLYKTEPPRGNIELLLNDQECPSLSVFKKKATKYSRLTRSDLAFLPESGRGFGGGGGGRKKKRKKKGKVFSPAPGSHRSPGRGRGRGGGGRGRRAVLAPETRSMMSSAPRSERRSAFEEKEADDGDLEERLAALSAVPTPEIRRQEARIEKSAVSRDFVRKTRMRSKRKKAYRSAD